MTAFRNDTADASTAAAALDDGEVRIRPLTELADHSAVVALLGEIWGRPANPPVTTELLRALAKADHYVSGAFAGTRLVGATIAFHGAPDRRILHSHIAGVDSEWAGRGIGYAMKLHQRAWAAERELEAIEWTFDPLVARNAHFNISKLGAFPAEYLVNFYGVMGDGLNGNDQTDRLLVRWAVGRDPESARLPGDVSMLRAVAVPDDIEELRRLDPERAGAWRRSVREELGGLMDAGGRVVGFERGRGYLVRLPGGER